MLMTPKKKRFYGNGESNTVDLEIWLYLDLILIHKEVISAEVTFLCHLRLKQL